MINLSSSFGRSGVLDWWLQRGSAVLMLVYVLVLFYQLLAIDEFNYITWMNVFNQVWMQIFTFITVIAIAVHAWVGLWIVSTDYMKPLAIRNVFQSFVLIVCLGMIIWTAIIFWG